MDAAHLTFARFPNNPRFKNLTGMTFGKLTVLGFAGQFHVGNDAQSLYAFWWCRCRCSCGKITKCRTASLTTQNSKTCGCSWKDAKVTHGCSRKGKMTPEYYVWAGMKKRCTNANEKQFCDYGGRGIYVCKGYMTFANFLADLGPRPTPKHMIDRIDVNGSYTCGTCAQCRKRGAKANCRWATRIQQNRNTRRNRRLEFQGVSLTLAEWSARLGIPLSTITGRRYRKRGALTAKEILDPNPRPTHPVRSAPSP